MFNAKNAAAERGRDTRRELAKVVEELDNTRRELQLGVDRGAYTDAAVRAIQDFIRVEGIRAGALEWVAELYETMANGREPFGS